MVVDFVLADWKQIVQIKAFAEIAGAYRSLSADSIVSLMFPRLNTEKL